MVKAALFDVDGTLVNGQTWRGITENPAVSRAKVRLLYARVMPIYLLSKRIPSLNATFRGWWIQGLAGLLQGWTLQQVEDLSQSIANEFLVPLYRHDVIARLQQYRTDGLPIILVSTMFPQVTQRIADYVGADAVIGTEMMFHDGKVTGQIVGKSCIGPRKAHFAQDYFDQLGSSITMQDCAAYSDSYSDLAFLLASGEAYAVYPDESLEAEAVKYDWEVIRA